MWPLGIFLLIATAAPPQQSVPSQFQLHRSNPALQQHKQLDRVPAQGLVEPGQAQGCFFIRSYIFHRQDGQAPVLTGMTTCTPANLLRQRQASPDPQVMFVPVSAQDEQQK